MKDKKSSTKFKEKPSKNMDKKPKNGMEDILADSRFAHIVSDPRYKNISSKKIKVKVDKRFKSALMNEKFTKKSVLDPRGKPKNYGTKEGLQRFYDMESSESDSDEDYDNDSAVDDEVDEDYDNGSAVDDEIDESIITNKQKKKMQSSKKSIKDQKSQGKENKNCKEEFMATLLNPERDLARGDTFYSDDSSDDDSSTTDEDEEENENLKVFEWGELDHDAQWDVEGQDVEETSRFAVCCMDWDNVKAVDLLVLFSSFAPSGGLVKKVTIYPSDFGKARLEEEELKGPEELVKLTTLSKKKHNDEFSDLEKLKKGTLEETDEASALELEALRRYQRNRLKYYYAVVECDSVETSMNIYRECDRTHFEVIGVTLDLRYIPSDMEFDEIPHDVCEKIPDSYESDNLQVSSLVQVKPTLTWDETDRRRKKAIKNAMSKALKKEKVNDELLNDFVANSESEEEDEREEDEEEESAASDEETEEGKQKKKNRIAKFRALISEIDEKESKKRELVFDMEETFDAAGEKGGDSDSDVSGGEGEIVDDGSEDVKKEEDEFKGLTPFEKLLTRRKQRKKERKMRIKELKEKARTGEESDDESGIENHDDSPDEEAKAKKKKGKKKKTKSKESEQKMSDADLALLVMNEEEEDKRHFDMKKIQEEKEKLEKKKRKRKNKDEKEEEEEKVDDFKVDVSDSRFSALFTHGSFNVDPSHPKYNKHSSLNQNIMQKQKKIKLNTEPVQQQVGNNSNMDTDISDMIRRFRMKTSKLK